MGVFIFLLELFIEFLEVFEVLRRGRNELVVADQANSLNCNRIANNLAVSGYSVPCKVSKLCFLFLGRIERSQKSGLCPLAETVVSPHDDIRTVLSGSGLHELHFYLIRVSYGNLDAGCFGEFLSDFGNSVIALVTV